MPSIVESRILRGPVQDVELFYRKGTSDEKCISEIFEQNWYRKKSVRVPSCGNTSFDVYEGEDWLDLGANIGTFAAYCVTRGASVDCYEPDPGCFDLLQRSLGDNPLVTLFNYAVTNRWEEELRFYKGQSPTDHYRSTIIPTRTRHPAGFLWNMHASEALVHKGWHGCKMDIEGSEFGLIEDDLLPSCNKLIMEYHFSRDHCMKNFRRRRSILQERFNGLRHVPSLNQDYPNDVYPGFFDRFIFCWM